jgi:hypothetical protein
MSPLTELRLLELLLLVVMFTTQLWRLDIRDRLQYPGGLSVSWSRP